jgi:hypothetical protein
MSRDSIAQWHVSAFSPFYCCWTKLSKGKAQMSNFTKLTRSSPSPEFWISWMDTSILSLQVPARGGSATSPFDCGWRKRKRYSVSWLGTCVDQKTAPELLKLHLPKESHAALVEIIPYFTGAFGSGQRLDYGTGHELSFAAFLCTLFLLRILDPVNDSVTAALVIFPKFSLTCTF